MQDKTNHWNWTNLLSKPKTGCQTTVLMRFCLFVGKLSQMCNPEAARIVWLNSEISDWRRLGRYLDKNDTRTLYSTIRGYESYWTVCTQTSLWVSSYICVCHTHLIITSTNTRIWLDSLGLTRFFTMQGSTVLTDRYNIYG